MGTFNCFSILFPEADLIIRICSSMAGSGLGPRPRNKLRKSVTKEAEPITAFANVWETFQLDDRRQLLAGKKQNAPARHRSCLRTAEKEKVRATVNPSG